LIISTWPWQEAMYNADIPAKHILGSALKLLLNNKADQWINMSCEERSPLYIASLEIHTEIVELLLNNNADPNICYIENSPLYTLLVVVIQRLSQCCWIKKLILIYVVKKLFIIHHFSSRSYRDCRTFDE
jgi:ankyrin repeat protein